MSGRQLPPHGGFGTLLFLEACRTTEVLRRVIASMSAIQWDPIDAKAVDTVRVLAADAVEKVGNGHPGTAMSLAPAAYLLFQRIMRRDPSDSTWIGRDRFILSAGHSSLTQYIQFYLGGYGLELKDLEELRTWGSKTPGHPEYGHTDGVEITTGPLGSGFAASVGFAYASRYERGLFDPDAAPGTSPFDHFVYVHHGRRRHGGGHHQRGRVARRPPGARQPDRDLRLQPDLDRGRHQHRLHRRRARAATSRWAGTCRSSTGRRPASTSKTSRSCTTRSRRRRASPTSRRSSS